MRVVMQRLEVVRVRRRGRRWREGGREIRLEKTLESHFSVAFLIVFSVAPAYFFFFTLFIFQDFVYDPSTIYVI